MEEFIHYPLDETDDIRLFIKQQVVTALRKECNLLWYILTDYISKEQIEEKLKELDSRHDIPYIRKEH